jgi:hypothetical protein
MEMIKRLIPQKIKQEIFYDKKLIKWIK